MHETKQQRDAYIKALVIELRDVKRAGEIAKARLKETPEDRRVDRVRYEEEVASLEERVGLIEEQLRAVKGDAPHKRAAKRAESSDIEKR